MNFKKERIHLQCANAKDLDAEVENVIFVY